MARWPPLPMPGRRLVSHEQKLKNPQEKSMQLPSMQVTRHVAPAVCALACSVAMAQGAFPERSLRMIVPTPAGGSTDLVAREIVEAASASLQQTIVVDNKPGANGIIAVQSLKQAPADGYTVLVSHTALIQNLALLAKPPYALSDVKPVAQVATSSVILAVSSSLGVNNFEEFVKLLRANPGKYSFGSSGVGSTTHIYGEMVKSVTKTDMLHVPFAGTPTTEVLAGRITAMWATPAVLLPYVKAGTLKLLAVTGTKRMAAAPDVPTFQELGHPQFDLVGWVGVFAPKGTPDDVVARLGRAIAEAVPTAKVSSRLQADGYAPQIRLGTSFQQYLEGETLRWRAAVKENGIPPQ